MPIVMIIFGIFVGGIYYHVWDESIVFIDQYIVYDEYYYLIRLMWDAIPIVMLLVGIVWLIVQGTKSKGAVEVNE